MPCRGGCPERGSRTGRNEPEDYTPADLEYILGFQPHCDKYLSGIAAPQGKTVLVIGSGKGTEMFWCLKRGARKVVGIDLRTYEPTALEMAIAQSGLTVAGQYEMVTLDVDRADSLNRTFDLVLSNNVFEHLPDIDNAFRVCRRLVAPKTGRIAVFTDPLYYSSMGGHLSHIEPWEHLWGDLEAIRARVNEWEWTNFLQLNKMTLAGFSTAIRKSDLSILKIETIPDRNLSLFDRYKDRIDPGLSEADLTTEGIAAELSC